MKIQARVTKVDASGKKVPQAPVTVEYDVPAGLDAKVKKFGADVIDAAAEDSIIISIQAFMRRLIGKGKTAAEVAVEVGKYQLSTRNLVLQSPFEKASTSLKSLSPEDRKKLLAELQAMK